MKTNRLLLLFVIVLLASCDKKFETVNAYWCENFSRVRERYVYRQDTTGERLLLSYLYDTIPNQTLCGEPDISSVHAGPYIHVHSWTPDPETLALFVDSTVIYYTQIK